MKPLPPRSAAEPPAADAAAVAQARELADYMAGQDPLDAEAAVWAARRQDGLHADEEAELQAWLAGDPARRRKMDQLTGVLGQLDRLPPDDVAALKAALPPVSGTARSEHGAPARRLEDARPRGHRPRDGGRRQWMARWGRRVPQLAMAGMAAMVVGGGWMGWNHWQQQPTFVQSFATPRGQQLTATLPEGSRLRLDTDNRPVSVPRNVVVFSADADIPGVPGLAAMAGVRYVGSQFYDLSNQRSIPSFTVVDAGARYSFASSNTQMVLRMGISNLFDKSHYQFADFTVQSGAPRTLKVALQADF